MQPYRAKWTLIACIKALRTARVLMPNSSLKSSEVSSNTSTPVTMLARNACTAPSKHGRTEGLSACVHTCPTHQGHALVPPP